MDTLALKKTRFLAHFRQKEVIISRSPGRVNLIGEHTDYNGGWVLPAAIDACATVLVAPNETSTIRVLAYDLKEEAEFSIFDDIPLGGWKNFVVGVIQEMRKKRPFTQGLDILISGDVPLGAGLSSSAAIECALAYAINELLGLGFHKKELALIAQAAEHHYVGVQCGIMDQYASLMGKMGHAIFLDCQKIEHQYIPIDLGADYTLLLCNTNVSHSLASSEYNTRRQQCEEGVRILQSHYHDIQLLRNVTLKMLEQHKDEFPTIIFQRCLYVIQENNRVHQAAKALRNGNLKTLGLLMYASHDGLSRMYEVSCPELDFLVDATKDKDYIIGSRMMGGGFGGCTINVIRKDAIATFLEYIQPLYQTTFTKDLTPIQAHIGDGARIV